MMTGWPPKVANTAKLAPGFMPHFAWLPFATALVLTALWVLLVLRLPSAPSRSAVRWAAGVVLFWGTFGTLWMPWADHIKTHRTGRAAASRNAVAASCVAGRNFGEPQQAALSYHAGLQILGPNRKPRCSLLVVQGTPEA